jgi:hypothetical protein
MLAAVKAKSMTKVKKGAGLGIRFSTKKRGVTSRLLVPPSTLLEAADGARLGVPWERTYTPDSPFTVGWRGRLQKFGAY